MTSLTGARYSPAWADYDNDGHPDLVAAVGQSTPRNAALYHNNGNGTFTSASDVFTLVPSNWLGSAWCDFNDDGFMDLLLTHRYGQNQLYRNLGNSNHWIKFKLVGTASNRDAIGAKVRVLAVIGGQSVLQMQEVSCGDPHQSDIRPNFGLGDATNVDLVRIEWPSGIVQELTPFRQTRSSRSLKTGIRRQPSLTLARWRPSPMKCDSRLRSQQQAPSTPSKPPQTW